MNHDDDARIDEALEALARPAPPTDHAARVLARTNATGAGSPLDAHDRSRNAYLRPRWILPVAATVLALLGATWQVQRQATATMDHAWAAEAAAHASEPRDWGLPEDIVRPVLPPQAYWGMDPFAEFATLRPGTRVTAGGASSPESGRRPVIAAVDRAADVASAAMSVRHTRADDELTGAPSSNGLPPIEIVSIVPAPLVAAPVAPAETITLAEIPLAPIVIAPLAEEERP